MVNTASLWSPADYARTANFVHELASEVLVLLAPQPGEQILDLGCGDGALSEKIGVLGARVIGLDASEEMVEAARARGVEAYVADAESLDLGGQVERFGLFDAVFSNAALHWMLDADAVASGVYAILRDGGRFIGEMGGAGNLARLRTALRNELTERGIEPPASDPHWYPTVEDFVRLYGVAGFVNVHAESFERPTPLPGSLADWLKTFRAGYFTMLGVSEADRDAIAAGVEARAEEALRGGDGTWVADYVRLRFAMAKPEAAS
ncbi:MAG: class I SAM-dependent methyltransferase [Sphingosinicella sp.]